MNENDNWWQEKYFISSSHVGSVVSMLDLWPKGCGFESYHALPWHKHQTKTQIFDVYHILMQIHNECRVLEHTLLRIQIKWSNLMVSTRDKETRDPTGPEITHLPDIYLKTKFKNSLYKNLGKVGVFCQNFFKFNWLTLHLKKLFEVSLLPSVLSDDRSVKFAKNLKNFKPGCFMKIWSNSVECFFKKRSFKHFQV